MMDCPRCGFSQPKDRYCANCGLDVELHRARPKPLWLRVLQSPNLHLGLIGLLMCAVVFYILYSRSSLVSREVHKILGTPIASRDAGEGEAAPAATTAVDEEPERPIEDEVAQVEPPTAEEAAPPTEPAAAPAAAAAEPKKLELTFFEVPHESLRGLVATAENAGEGTAGRAFLVRTDGAKVAEAIRNGGRRLGEPRTLGLNAGQQLTIVTPPSTQEPFQFGLSLQIARMENREATVRWDSQVVLGQPESAAEMAANGPAMRAVTEANLTGSGTLGPHMVLILILEPANRRPRPEFLLKAGDGPWSIFNSEDFRAQLTDWVALIQQK